MRKIAIIMAVAALVVALAAGTAAAKQGGKGMATYRKVIPGMTLKKATAIMWEAHSKGRAVVKSCHKELAELYEERLRREGLTVSIEPAR